MENNDATMAAERVVYGVVYGRVFASLPMVGQMGMPFE